MLTKLYQRVRDLLKPTPRPITLTDMGYFVALICVQVGPRVTLRATQEVDGSITLEVSLARGVSLVEEEYVRESGRVLSRSFSNVKFQIVPAAGAQTTNLN